MFGRKKKREQERTLIDTALRTYLLRVSGSNGKRIPYQDQEWRPWQRLRRDQVPPAVAELLRVPGVKGVVINYQTGNMRAEYRVSGNED